MNEPKPQRMARLLGIGLDDEDGHIRVTEGETFAIYLGSESTHERLREICTALQSRIRRRGKRLEDLTREELAELLSGLA